MKLNSFYQEKLEIQLILLEAAAMWFAIRHASF